MESIHISSYTSINVCTLLYADVYMYVCFCLIVCVYLYQYVYQYVYIYTYIDISGRPIQ